MKKKTPKTLEINTEKTWPEEERQIYYNIYDINYFKSRIEFFRRKELDCK